MKPSGQMIAGFSKTLEAINASVSFDQRLARHDVECTAAHVAMLAKQGILRQADRDILLAALDVVRELVSSGRFEFRPELEDVHLNIEKAVTSIAGPVAEHIGMARARNDQAVTVLRMWIREAVDRIGKALLELASILAEHGSKHAAAVMPGMTHMQAAQPVTWGHLCLAYAEMFYRDAERFAAVRGWLNRSPLGACALAGTGFDIDRDYTAARLGFSGPTTNSIDSVADRDFVLDYLSACATAAVHMSRISEDLIVWIAPQFGYVRLPDFLVGRSAMMPHKRNPDALELVRARCARVISNLNTVQIVLKGLTMSYSRDLQEDKEAVFDTTDTLELSLAVFVLVFEHIELDEATLRQAAGSGFTTSTDYADWLCREKGFTFAAAHHAVTELVELAVQKKCRLAELSQAERIPIDDRLGSDDWPDIDAEVSVASRTSFGGAAPTRVAAAAVAMKQRIGELAGAFPDFQKHQGEDE